MTDRRGGLWGQVPLWIAGAGLSAIELRVYVALAGRRNRRTKQCNPSYQRLATDTNMHISKIPKALDGLRKKGIVLWENNGSPTNRKSNQYSLAETRPFPIPNERERSKSDSTPLSKSDSKVLSKKDRQTPKDNNETEHSVETTSLTDCSSDDELAENEARAIINRAIGFYKHNLGTDPEDAERKDLFPIAWKAFKNGDIKLSEEVEANDWVFDLF